MQLLVLPTLPTACVFLCYSCVLVHLARQTRPLQYWLGNAAFLRQSSVDIVSS